MNGLVLHKPAAESLHVLCLGAHSDDIEIGCGGALLQLKRQYPKAVFYWVVFSAVGIRKNEAAMGAELFTRGHEKQVILKEFRDGFLPYSGASVKDDFEELKKLPTPDLIFTHWQGDAHQDHRILSELTQNTFRNHLIFEYEIPKYDGDMGRPNLYVPLDTDIPEQKANHLLESFQSQRGKAWFDRNLFLGLMRIRGMESNSPSGYAEAFHARKIVLGGKN